MKADMNGPLVTQKLAEDQKFADAHGLNRSPSFMVGSQPVVGLYPYTDFKKFIDKELDGR
jgi:protein-disulfide isomerase